MRITDFLDQSGVSYEVTEHQSVFTAQQVAAVEHEPGKYVAKPVIVKTDDKYIMCVLQACCKVDIDALKNQMSAKSVELAHEEEIVKLFADCELGAEPPFGNLYDLSTVIDKALREHDHIMFQGGTHENAIHMSMADYIKLVEPKVLDFSYHAS